MSFAPPMSPLTELDDGVVSSMEGFSDFWNGKKGYDSKTAQEKNELLLGPIFGLLPRDLMSMILGHVKTTTESWHSIIEYARVNSLWYAYWTSDTVFGGYIPHFVLDRSNVPNVRLVAPSVDPSWKPEVHSIRDMHIKENIHLNVSKQYEAGSIHELINTIRSYEWARSHLLNFLSYSTIPVKTLSTSLLETEQERRKIFISKLDNLLSEGEAKKRQQFTATEIVLQKRWDAEKLLDIVENEHNVMNRDDGTQAYQVMDLIVPSLHQAPAPGLFETDYKRNLRQLLPFKGWSRMLTVRESKLASKNKAVRYVYDIGPMCEESPKPKKKAKITK